MNKRILICLLALGLGLQQTGCTSSSSMDESDVAQANDDTFAEESEGDFEEELAANADPVEGDEAEAELAEEGSGEETAVAENTEGEASGDDLSLDEGEELSLDGGDEGGEGGEGGEGTAVASNSGGDAGMEGDELSLDDPEALPEEVATSEPLEGDLGGGMEEPPMAAANEPPPSDEPLFTPEAASSEGSEVASNGDSGGGSFTETASPAPAASFIPVKKIRDAAFTKAGANLNRVYIARPGDTVKGASKKIYGTNRSSDHLLWNGHLQGGMKTGDKMYYTSPTNPQDSRMLTYYEDVNANPSTYVSKEGDNIRTVSKELLGFSGAWKEVWATNFNVESKGDIPAGTELKYWSDSSASMPLANNGTGQDMGGSQPEMPPMDMAQNSPDGMQDPGFGGGPGAPPPPPGGDMGAPPPMPPSDFAANGAPPPPPMDPPMDPSGGAMAGVDPLAPPPPPPPPMEAAPPPEPKPVAKRPPMDEVSESGMGDPDTVMMMGFAGILIIAAAVLFVVIRKNRSRRMDLGQTQV